MNDWDISQRKQAEQALRESEHRFRDYAETAFDWFWEMGPDFRFTNLSHQAPFRASVIGATRWAVAADVDEEPEKWRVHRAILDASEPFRDFTYKTVRPDGSTMSVSVSGKPVFNEQGGFLGYRGAAKDVSDRVRADEAERALQETRLELERIARVTTLGALTASIINQPPSSRARAPDRGGSAQSRPISPKPGERWRGSRKTASGRAT